MRASALAGPRLTSRSIAGIAIIHRPQEARRPNKTKHDLCFVSLAVGKESLEKRFKFSVGYDSDAETRIFLCESNSKVYDGFNVTTSPETDKTSSFHRLKVTEVTR